MRLEACMRALRKVLFACFLLVAGAVVVESQAFGIRCPTCKGARTLQRTMLGTQIGFTCPTCTGLGKTSWETHIIRNLPAYGEVAITCPGCDGKGELTPRK